MVPEEKLPAICGLDHTLHVRYLRCCCEFLALPEFCSLPLNLASLNTSLSKERTD